MDRVQFLSGPKFDFCLRTYKSIYSIISINKEAHLRSLGLTLRPITTQYENYIEDQYICIWASNVFNKMYLEDKNDRFLINNYVCLLGKQKVRIYIYILDQGDNIIPSLHIYLFVCLCDSPPNIEHTSNLFKNSLQLQL